MKLWCYYLIETRELYAISPSKELAKKFEEQRCMASFIKKIKHLNATERGEVLTFNRNIILVEAPLFDGSKHISMALTQNEDSLITYEMERLMDEVNAIVTRWKKDGTIPSKLKTIVLQYLDLFATSIDTTLVSNINAFRICYMLFRNTFEDGGKPVEFKPGEECLLDVN